MTVTVVSMDCERLLWDPYGNPYRDHGLWCMSTACTKTHRASRAHAALSCVELDRPSVEALLCRLRAYHGVGMDSRLIMQCAVHTEDLLTETSMLIAIESEAKPSDVHLEETYLKRSTPLLASTSTATVGHEHGTSAWQALLHHPLHLWHGLQLDR